MKRADPEMSLLWVLNGSFLELQVDQGRVSVVRSGTNRELDERATRDVTTVDGGFSATWGPYGAQRRWYSSNLSLDFPSVSAVWAALYERQYAVKLDGLVGATPEALTSILPHTGPIPLPDEGTLDAQNAARFLEAGLYAKFPLSVDEGRRNAINCRCCRGSSADSSSLRPPLQGWFGQLGRMSPTGRCDWLPRTRRSRRS